MVDPESIFAEAAQQLKRTVLEGRTFDAAQVKVIGLDDVCRAAGARWPIIKERVRVNSMNFLQAALGADDIVIPCGDGFLLIFAGDSGRNMQSEADTLQQALNTFYMGEEAMRELRANVTPHTLSSGDVASLISHESAVVEKPEPSDVIRFAPIYNVAQAVIASYAITPTTGHGPHMRIGHNLDYRQTGHHEKCDFTALDLAILDKAIDEAMRIQDGPYRCLIGYSVHVTTLKNRNSREQISKRLSAAPAQAQKHMVGKIAEIEIGTPLSNIIEWVSLLRRCTPAVSLEFHHTERAFEGLEQTRAISAGFYLPHPPIDTAETRARAHTLIARWRQALTRQRLRFFVDGMNDPLLLQGVLDEAVDFVTSERQWPLGLQSYGVRTFNRTDIGPIPKSA